jgi:hypothetical protein
LWRLTSELTSSTFSSPADGTRRAA